MRGLAWNRHHHQRIKRRVVRDHYWGIGSYGSYTDDQLPRMIGIAATHPNVCSKNCMCKWTYHKYRFSIRKNCQESISELSALGTDSMLMYGIRCEKCDCYIGESSIGMCNQCFHLYLLN